MQLKQTDPLAGKSHIAPLVGEMLQRIQAEVARYERVITYWPTFGPSLEAAVCAALRTTTAAVSRQCGLIPMIGVRHLLMPTLSSLQQCTCFSQATVQIRNMLSLSECQTWTIRHLCIGVKLTVIDIGLGQCR